MSVRVPPNPPDPPPELSEDAYPLGEALRASADEVLELTLARSRGREEVADPDLQDRFERISRNSTLAVAGWIAGQGVEAAIEAGGETWEIYGELAARRAASLYQLTKRCVWWRDAVAEILRRSAQQLGSPPEALAQALTIVHLSLEFSLVKMSKCFDAERQKIEEELARRGEELSFMATHDPLTGLPNRTLIADRAEQMLARCTRAPGRVSALFIDIDNFKAVNDTLGHSAGDKLLQAVAARLDGVVRGSDALGRLGGDEFVMICEQPPRDAGPELIAERVLEALEPPFTLRGDRESSVNVTVSIGIAVGERSSAEELLREADIAMYRAKRDGRNRYAVFESNMNDVIQARVQLEADLRKALRHEEFFLAYQPILALADLSTTGVEALIRWRHPTQGVVPPEEFIPLAEETGLINEIGTWVLEQATAQAAAWRDAGHRIGVAVNVSARQLDSDKLISDIKTALAFSGLEPEALTIEITETMLMRNVEETVRRLDAIKELGVQIAIDDFGTGYSSLAQLQQFPVDALKIDRSFIAGLSKNKEAGALIHTLVQLGKALSLQTLAEGIELQAQLAKLREENCDSGQGFLFARPLETGDAEIYLHQHPCLGPHPSTHEQVESSVATLESLERESSPASRTGRRANG